jgi:AcrR family transcriptional regulator
MRKNAVKEEIIRTASRLFYKQGYNSTGINQIIDEAGIAKASLYQNFRSKEDLLAEYLKTAAIITNEALDAAVAKHQDPKEKVMAVFDALNNMFLQDEYYGCNFLNIVSEIPVENTRIREQIKAQKDHIRNMFAEILKPVKKECLADDLYLLFDGALITNKVHNATWPVDSAKKIASQLL